MILFGTHPLQDIILNQLLRICFATIVRIACKLDALIFAIKIGGKIRMGVALAVVSEKVIEALFQGIT